METRCHAHNREFVFFCRSCQMLFCCKCLRAHDSHDYTEIEDCESETASVEAAIRSDVKTLQATVEQCEAQRKQHAALQQNADLRLDADLLAVDRDIETALRDNHRLCQSLLAGVRKQKDMALQYLGKMQAFLTSVDTTNKTALLKAEGVLADSENGKNLKELLHRWHWLQSAYEPIALPARHALHLSKPCFSFDCAAETWSAEEVHLHSLLNHS